jgi:cytochrome c-type biogenesis protein CcmE
MTQPRRTLSRNRLLVLLLLIGAAFGFLLWRGLNNATVYFRTADQAAAERPTLGDKTFRLEGTVLAGSVKRSGNTVKFVVKGTHTTVPVQHTGDEPGLFREGIPVVMEGHFSGKTFESSQILIKHSETYKQTNPGRVKDYPK